jgi:DNA mismatch repair protein MutS
VVDRARDVLDRLRSERAIEAKGGGDGDPVQAVFDLSSGQFREDRSTASDSGNVDADPDADAAPGPEAEVVLEELRGADVEATAPVELLSKVRAWQRRLEDE